MEINLKCHDNDLARDAALILCHYDEEHPNYTTQWKRAMLTLTEGQLQGNTFIYGLLRIGLAYQIAPPPPSD